MADYKNDINTIKLNKAIELLNLKYPVTEIANRLEYSKGNVSNFINGKKRVPLDFLDKFYTTFEINDDSTEVASVSFKQKKGRPFYDVDFTLGFDQLDNDVELHPEFNIDFAPANKESITWFRGKGNSMLGEIDSGDYIALEEINNFEWFPLGRIYGIVTKNGFRTIKRIVKSESPGHYLLKASNPDKTSHPDQDIPKDIIYKLFKVVYVIKDLNE
ncbi:S24 family peptidase [Vaginella massiliensis]|uniref:S24 family peptidase n=1 Tax=Vaginella massiliensis TaxID=1816680 RepID=UPI003750889E